MAITDSIRPEAAFDCMKAAWDAGVNFFDCAEGYAGGKSEEVIGQAIKKFGCVDYHPRINFQSLTQWPDGRGTTL